MKGEVNVCMWNIFIVFICIFSRAWMRVTTCSCYWFTKMKGESDGIYGGRSGQLLASPQGVFP